MATYIEYMLEDGSKLLIEAHESESLIEKTANTEGNVIVHAGQKFEAAVAGAKRAAVALYQQLRELQADEVEVTFGLQTTGELGNFAIGKVGIESNYEVKLKWKNSNSSQSAGT